MQTIIGEYREWKPETRNQRAQSEIEAQHLEGETILLGEEGEPIACVLELKGEAGKRADLLGRMIQRGITWDVPSANGGARLSGIRYGNRTFGTTAPQPLRRRYGCRQSAFHAERPDVVGLLGEVFYGAWETFNENLPEAAQATDAKTAESIHDDWRFAGTPWTSGIINDNASLPYHKDSGNLTDSWSAMIVLRHKADGGALHLPEYGVTLDCFDKSLVFFDGQALWHGVTPIRLRNKEAFRRSIVMYSKSACKNCGPAHLEAARAAREATEHDIHRESVLGLKKGKK
ncbi:MAG: hypothetical protein ACO3VQ_05200 [Ilumatobacteraceae bacterium]